MSSRNPNPTQRGDISEVVDAIMRVLSNHASRATVTALVEAFYEKHPPKDPTESLDDALKRLTVMFQELEGNDA